MSPLHKPLVVLGEQLDGKPRHQTAAALRRIAREAVEHIAANGGVYAELRIAPHAHGAEGVGVDEVMAAVHDGIEDAAGETCSTNLIVCATQHLAESAWCEIADLAVRWMGERVVGLDLGAGEVGPLTGDRVRVVAAEAGLGLTVHVGEADGVAQLRRTLDRCRPDRIGHGWRLIDDCDVEENRIVAVGPTAAAVRDGGIALEIGGLADEHLGTAVVDQSVRLLFDAGFRIALSSGDRSSTTHQFSELELAACVERAAGAAFLPDNERDALVDLVRDGWNARPGRLVHLAERDRWEAARSQGSYLPAEWARDGFIHLSALHQLLTPANRFYRGRTDLIALVVDAHLLGSAVVWEAGTGTVERFPHLYAALTPEAVLGEHALQPAVDGGFLLPPALMRAVRSPVGG